jgi:RNA polymerase sigma factor (TIGR02999 family)
MSAEEPIDAGRVATLIEAADRSDGAAASTLFATLYRELHRIAARELRRGAAGSTLGATTLVHECYLNLSQRDPAFPDRARFIAYAARAMRNLIVDYIRERHAQKRGGEFHLTALDTAVVDEHPQDTSTEKVAESLEELASIDPSLATLVDLKFFCGLSFTEIAAMRGVSERTVQRDWQKARLVLHQSLGAE